MARKLQNFSGGEWVDATNEVVRDIVSPVSGETIAEAPARARRTWLGRRARRKPRWAARSAWDRVEDVERLETAVIPGPT